MGANTDRAVEAYFTDARNWDILKEEGIIIPKTKYDYMKYSLLNQDEIAEFFDRTVISVSTCRNY